MASNSTISVTFKLDGDNKSFKELQQDAEGLKKALNSTASEAAQLPKKFDYAALAKNLAGVTAAASAVGAAIGKLAGDAVNLTQTWGDRWSIEMAGARSAYQHLVRDLASGDGWGQLIERMEAAGDAGRRLATILDELFERKVGLSYTEADINKQISEQQLIMRDASKTDVERQAAAKKILEMTDSLASLKKDIAQQEADAYRDQFKAQTHLTDEQTDFLLKEYNTNREIINQAREYLELKKKAGAEMSTARQNVMYGGFGGAINGGAMDTAARKMEELESNTSQAIKAIAELVQLYDRGNDELVQSMADAEVAVINLQTEANRTKLRPTATLGTLTKSQVRSAGSVRQTVGDSDELRALAEESARCEAAADRAVAALMNFYGVDPSALDPIIAQIERIGDTANGVVPELQGMLDQIQNGITDNLTKSLNTDSLSSTTEAISAMANVMSGLNGIVGESASSWLSWGANVVKSIAAAIPAIVQLTAAQGAEATANTVSATTGAASSVANVPIVGPALAITAMATVLAAILSSISSIPKFAEGGIAFGPTLGLFGEYSGASNNPEVVAPLDKLRGMLNDGGAGTPKVVELRAKGRDLYGIINLESDIRRRS